LKIIFAIVNATNKSKKPGMTQKLLSNSKLSATPVKINWNWETQKKWGGKCSSTLMQSPIRIIETPISGEAIDGSGSTEAFKVSYNLLNTHVEVVRRFNEIVVKFVNDPGLIMVESGNKRTLFQPKYISFRFPGEHNINGKRYSGDMLVNCREVSEKKTQTSNGLILTVPLDAQASHTNFKEFESLSVDFWKYMVLKKGSYKPINYITKKSMVFKLGDIMKEATSSKPNFYFYLGSKTVPPCDEYVYHLVIGTPIKIANCQFKVLRENTLATTEPRQIHSRLTQFNNPDQYDDDEVADSAAAAAKGVAKSKAKASAKGTKKSAKGSKKSKSHKKKRSTAIRAVRKVVYVADLSKYIPKAVKMLMKKKKALLPKKFSSKKSLLRSVLDSEEDDDELNC